MQGLSWRSPSLFAVVQPKTGFVITQPELVIPTAIYKLFISILELNIPSLFD